MSRTDEAKHDEFLRAHGLHPLEYVEPNGLKTLILPDGAVFTPNTLAGGITYYEVPTDKKRCLEIREAYWTMRVQIAEESFDAAKGIALGKRDGSVKQRAWWPPLPKSRDEEVRLAYLRDVVVSERAELKKIVDAIEPPARRAARIKKEKREAREHEERLAESQAEAQRIREEFINKLIAIQI